jgi:protein polybromo-1
VVVPVCSDLQTPPSCLKEVLEQLLDAVVSYTDPSGRVISELFQKLPSKVHYPDYYAVIKEPLDLRAITQRIQVICAICVELIDI